MKLAKGCKPWILSAFFAGVLFLVLSILTKDTSFAPVSFLICFCLFLLTVFFLVFFRDPERIIGNNVVACADGKVREISTVKDKDIGESINVSTFMFIQNVHVNRLPISGTIKSVEHIDGFHLPAFKKESEKNERAIILVDTNIGKIKIILIAGTLARRIVPYIKIGDKLKKGERIGIIRLGSRVDVYLPKNKIKKTCVKVGSRIKAGVDTIAEINA